MVNSVNANGILSIASANLKIGLRAGEYVTTAVAAAIVWNDCLAGECGQQPEKRNAMLARIKRRLMDMGGKRTSLETWISTGGRLATGYIGEIERVIRGVVNAPGRNSEPSPREVHAAVYDWAKAHWPQFGDLRSDVNAAPAKSDDEKARAKVRALITQINKLNDAVALADIARVADARACLSGVFGPVSEERRAQAEAALAWAAKAWAEPDGEDAEEAPEEAEAAPIAEAA